MKSSGTRAFVIFGIGQVISIFGTTLSSFALGVWVFQQTQSVMQLALVAIFITLPGIFVRPVAGALVDRWDRRGVLIACDAIAAALTLATLGFVRAGELSVWYIYVMTAVQTALVAFQLPASSAAMQLLVPARQVGQASGAIGASKSVSAIIAPLVAGALLVVVGLEGVLLIDLLTFVVAVATLLLIRVPAVQGRAAAAATTSLYQEIVDGWAYIARQRGFILLVIFSMLVTALFETARVLLTPLLLSFTTPGVLGAITSAASFGTLVGSVAMMIWGGPRRRTYGILGFGFTIGASLVLGGLRQSALLIGLAVVLAMTGIPVVWGCIEAIWLTKVAPTLIGRVKGATNTLESALATVTLLAAGISADGLFEPALAPGGALAPSVGRLIGVGPGRGVALMLIIAGLLTLILVSYATLNPAVRLLEDALPDVDLTTYLADDPRTVAPEAAAIVER